MKKIANEKEKEKRKMLAKKKRKKGIDNEKKDKN